MSLFDKVKVGKLVFKNRIVMAAMTRLRADPATGLANQLHKEYYSQRAGAGLILTEASAISQRGHSWPGSANITNKEQAEAWKPVVQAVKKKGSHIFLQIYHGGRNCHKLINGGLETWGPSPIAQRGKFRGTQQPYDKPHEMTESDIKTAIEQFHQAAKLAKQVGFDGIHIHSAAGYLLDSFIRDGSNKRTDNYGGSAENRARLLLEVVRSVKTVFSLDGISVKLSPVMRYGDMNDSNPKQTYSKILQLLDREKVNIVEIVSELNEPVLFDYPDPKVQFPNILRELRPFFSGIVIGNQGFDPESAQRAISNNECDMVSFAKHYINNPDLAERIEKNQPLNTVLNQSAVYGGTDIGYTDYPFFKSN